MTSIEERARQRTVLDLNERIFEKCWVALANSCAVNLIGVSVKTGRLIQ